MKISPLITQVPTWLNFVLFISVLHSSNTGIYDNLTSSQNHNKLKKNGTVKKKNIIS